MWFFRPRHSQLQRLYLVDLMGDVSLPISDMVHRQCTKVSGGSFSQRFRAPSPIMLFTFLALAPSFLSLFFWGLGMTSSLVTSTEVGGCQRGKPEDTFNHFDSVPSPFPLPAFPLQQTLGPRVHKTEEAFVEGSLNSLCRSFWPLTSVPFHKKKRSKRSWCFLPFGALAYIPQ